MKVKIINDLSITQNSTLSNFNPTIMQSIVLNVPKKFDDSEI